MASPQTQSERLQSLSQTAELRPWLDEIMTLTGAPLRLAACQEFAAVLQALCAQLAPEADTLASQLPPPIREIYGEGVGGRTPPPAKNTPPVPPKAFEQMGNKRSRTYVGLATGG